MRSTHSRWWWLAAAVPVVVLMDVSTEFLTRTGHIPQPLWISACVTPTVSLLLLAIIVSRQHDAIAAGRERGLSTRWS